MRRVGSFCTMCPKSASAYNALLEGSSEVDAVCTWFRHANFARFLKFFHHLGLLASRVDPWSLQNLKTGSDEMFFDSVHSCSSIIPALIKINLVYPKKADGQASRYTEAQKSARDFSHGFNLEDYQPILQRHKGPITNCTLCTQDRPVNWSRMTIRKTYLQKKWF